MEALPSGPAPLRLAAVRIGAIDVGIPAGAVLQALPASAARHVPPRRRGALCGVVEHDGRLLPVVDLARWVDVGGAGGDASASAFQHARIVLLRDGARRLGLRVDDVKGLVDAAGEPVRLHRDDDPEEVFHTVARSHAPDLLLSVLDVARLAALAMAWHEEADAGIAATMEPAAGAAARKTVQYALVRCGGVRLAVPAADVAEVLPMPRVERAGFGLACAIWRGRHVPVLPAGLLADPADGTGSGNGGIAPPLLAVIEHGGLALGMPVDAVLGMASFADARDGLPVPGGIAYAAHDADGAVLLLDSARLLARFPEAALSRSAGTPAAGGAGALRRNPTTHIVFEADGLASTPIDAVEQVLPYAPPAPDAQASGTLAWRGKTLALADLRRTATDTGHVMVVRRGDRHTAYVVARVHLLIPPQGGTLYRMGAGAQAVEFIGVGDGAGQASYRTVDLAS